MGTASAGEAAMQDVDGRDVAFRRSRIGDQLERHIFSSGEHSEQPGALNAAALQLPGASAVVRRQDGAHVAARPTIIRIYE